MNKIKLNKGFTLIELMVVIVIIGILVAIALPNFIAAQDRAKLASVKSNMKTFQTMLETYGVDWGGVYPRTKLELSTEAISKNYEKQYKNPFTGVLLKLSNNGFAKSQAEIISGLNEPNTWEPSQVYTGTGTTNCSGQVVYRRSLASEAYTRYTIYGLDKEAMFITDKGRVFVITNM